MLQNAEYPAIPHVWNFPSHQRTISSQLAELCHIPLSIANILYERGYTTKRDIEQFLSPEQFAHPSPWLLADMESAVHRIVRAIRQEEKIIVYGDYDVDGQASTALVVDALRRLGADVSYYIPHRIDDGYGLSEGIVKRLAADTDLIITVDCGITSVTEVALATRYECDIIITDHHEPGSDLPQAVAVINPKRADCEYPDKKLAGCGVAYKLIEALYETLERNKEELHDWLDLVALATVADVVPLQNENRAFVAKGLKRFSSRVGLQALCQVAGVDVQHPTAGQVAFSIAPRLNAAGRLSDAGMGVKLLLTDDSAQAERIAKTLDHFNEERRKIEERITVEAQQWIERHVNLNEARALVVAGEGWHQGVIGIVASRLVELYHRPAIVFSVSDGEATGSGRSIHSFDLISALQQMAPLFDRFGGHSMAAGMTLPAHKLEKFRQQLLHFAAEQLAPVDLVPRLRIDAVIPFEDVDDTLCHTLQSMAPFGFGNPEPNIVIQNARIIDSRRVGRDQSHWRCILGQTDGTKQVQGIGFRLAPSLSDTFHAGDVVDVVGCLQHNEWQGSKQIQVQIRDARPACHITRHIQHVEFPIQDVSNGIPPTQRGEKAYGPTTMQFNDLSGTIHLYDWRNDNASTEKPLKRGLLAAQRSSRHIIIWSAEHKYQAISHVHHVKEEEGAKSVYVCTGDLIQNSPMPGKVALIFASLPDNADTMQRLIQQAMTWSTELEVHLAFTLQQVQTALERKKSFIPDIDTLRAIYVCMRQTFHTDRQAVVDIRRLVKALAEQNIYVAPAGLLHAWHIFSETSLMNWEQSGPYTYRITMHPTGRSKVDLTLSVRYNDGEREREQFQRFAKALMQHSGPDILKCMQHTA